MIRYIQPFASACKMVFKRFVGADIKAERPYYAGEKEVSGWDLFGIIGFSGDARGSLVIAMKRELAFKLTAALTGKIYTELESDVLDAVGELVNIIAGHVKKRAGRRPRPRHIPSYHRERV